MRPLTLTLSLLALTAACENSNDPLLFGQGGGGGAVTQVEATGNWTFSVNQTTTLPCTGGSLPDGTRITAHLDVLADGTVNSSTSNWQTTTTATVFPLSGSVTLASGSTDLTLSGGGSSGMELTGTMGPSGSFSGTLHDPSAGLAPMFSAGGCEYSTAGTKA